MRWQPDSALTQWFERRFASAGKRARRIGIVALARKLMIALWRYVEHGVVPGWGAPDDRRSDNARASRACRLVRAARLISGFLREPLIQMERRAPRSGA